MELIIQIVLLAIGFLLLTKGADYFVDGAAGIAQRLGISQLVTGLTIVAMGTSAPEAAVSISAALKGNADITVGNIIGSNLMNILLILGITAAITIIPVSRQLLTADIPFMLGVFVIFIFLGADGAVTSGDGLFLWALFILYLTYLFITARRGIISADDIPDAHGKSVLWLILITLTGLALITLGSNISVEAASSLALLLGMSERLVGLTIVAFGTSLPELVTSITAAIKQKSDIAVGNIIGSCLFNILFVLGTSALITNVHFAKAFQLDAWFCVAAGALLVLCAAPKMRLGRVSGTILLIAYGLYLLFIGL